MKTKLIFISVLLFCTAVIFAQEVIQEPEDTPQTASNIELAIQNGECETLYNALYNEEMRPSGYYNRIQDILEDYRKPNTHLLRYHTGRMEKNVASIPQNIQLSLKDMPETVVPELVKHLTKGAQNDFIKVKILHDWICNNIVYDAEMFFSGTIENQDYISVIKSGKAVCEGYANLFKEMCAQAKIEAIVIHGWSKGLGYTGKLSPEPDHAWNGVKIGKKWYLVDATWDAGVLEEKTFVKRYSTEYLFLESSAFLFTHLPLENAYQYFAPCKTKEQFEQSPRLTGKFFELGFGYSDSIPVNTLEIAFPKIISVPFKVSQAQARIQMHSKGSTSSCNTVWTERQGASIQLEIDVPDTAEYELVLRATDPKNLRFPMKFSEDEFSSIVQQVSSLIEDGVLRSEDESYLQESYFKSEENGNYYLWEDQFSANKNASLRRIFTQVKPDYGFEDAYSFAVKTEGSYKGCGTTNKYPYIHAEFFETSGTSLISPKRAILGGEKPVKFVVKTTEFLHVELLLEGERIPFKKNSANGLYELYRKIPDGAEASILVSNYKRSPVALWTFNKEESSTSGERGTQTSLQSASSSAEAK